ASLMGYMYMRYHISFLTNIIRIFKKSNPKLNFNSNFSEEIKELLKKDENKEIEFKSTLRTNLHTMQVDKEIEKTALKTIAAFLNSEGGTLLIGISDNKEIIGIEKDNFRNQDKFNLHLMNLIKERIGKKHLPLIDVQIGKIDKKQIARIDCNPSPKPIFLKEGKEEHFYIRAGPSTTELKASTLLGYIEKRFKK
ncbi:hypothetical protein B6U91_00900, partial [Candidatus Pacearchaeota archaeon ex4484_71]